MTLRLCAAMCAGLMLAGCATSTRPNAGSDTDAMLLAMMAGESHVSGSALDAAIARAQAHPFGSRDNPVRASGPPGQRAYLARLRCADLKPPAFERGGSVGLSPYGNMMDVYVVTCTGSEPAEREVFMDMYHAGHVEDEAVPGYGIVGGRPGE